MAVTLLTGSEGFVSRHVRRLIADPICGVDSYDERVHGRRRKGERVGRVGVWVGDYSEVPDTHLQSVDTVIHLAAQVSVADSAVDPERYMQQNSLGTATFLKRLPASVKRLVVASSMSVYGEGGVHVKESAAVNPTSVYGLSKYDQERLCLIWGEQHQIPVTALRFFNIYGPGQSLNNPYTGVLANFAKAFLEGRQPTIFEDGLQTRDFIHVSDVAKAVMCAVDAEKSGVYNVCTGKATTVYDAARHLASSLGKPFAPDITHTVRSGDIRHCTGDPSRASADLGFVSRIPFEVGIKEYADNLVGQVALCGK